MRERTCSRCGKSKQARYFDSKPSRKPICLDCKKNYAPVSFLSNVKDAADYIEEFMDDK